MTPRIRKTLHVLIGRFGDEPSALGYAEAKYLPEPSEDASDEEYAAWENAPRRWPLREDLGVYLDEDFVEMIFGGADGQAGANWDYLVTQIGADAARECRDRSPEGSDTLVLVMEDALGGFDGTIRSTPRLAYLGAFPWIAA